MTARLHLDEEGAPVVVVDVNGTPRQLTAWGVVDAGEAVALLLSTGQPLTAQQAAAIAGQLDPETIERLRLANDGRLTAIEHATAWEAEARAARRPTLGPGTEPIPRIPAAAGPATVEIALSVAPVHVDWVGLDQPTGRPAHLDHHDQYDDEDLVDEQPRTRWVDVLALLLLAALGIAGIIAGVAFDSLVVGIFGAGCAGAALGVAVATP